MEIFSPNHANAYGRAYTVTPEEYLQQSQEPPDRLTRRELQQLREIREEIESRPKLTRFEKRYKRILRIGEDEFGRNRSASHLEIAKLRSALNEARRVETDERRSITLAFLICEIAKCIT